MKPRGGSRRTGSESALVSSRKRTLTTRPRGRERGREHPRRSGRRPGRQHPLPERDPRAGCARRSEQTAGSRSSNVCRSANVTLLVHPRYGEEIVVLSTYGRGAVWAETSDGGLRLLPIAWTSLHPRGEPLAFGAQPVRLAPEALLELAGWVVARLLDARGDGQEVGHFGKCGEDRVPDGSTSDRTAGGAARGDGERSSAGGESASAVVGEVGAPSARGRAQRATRGTR
jgi:hypothetical protein